MKETIIARHTVDKNTSRQFPGKQENKYKKIIKDCFNAFSNISGIVWAVVVILIALVLWVTTFNKT